MNNSFELKKGIKLILSCIDLRKLYIKILIACTDIISFRKLIHYFSILFTSKVIVNKLDDGNLAFLKI